MLWRIGDRALGFAGHPGFKVAMVEDLIMEFTEGPDLDPAVRELQMAGATDTASQSLPAMPGSRVVAFAMSARLVQPGQDDSH